MKENKIKTHINNNLTTLISGHLYTPLDTAKEIHSFEVAFPSQLNKLPRIVCCPDYSYLQYIRPLTFAIDNVSQNGFTIHVCSDNDSSDGVGSLGFYWIAVVS